MSCLRSALLASAALLAANAEHVKKLQSPQSVLAADHHATLSEASANVEHKVMSFLRGTRPVSEDEAGLIDAKEFAVMSKGEVIGSFFIWLVFYALVSWYYHSHVRTYIPVDEKLVKQETRIHYDDFKSFKFGLFDCGQWSDITFWSCFCPGIRWADTMSKFYQPGTTTPIHSYWNGFAIMTVLYCIGFLPIMTLPCYLIVVLYMTYHRQEIRNTLEFEEKGGSSWCTDCLTIWCCMCCTVAQEARQCREAIHAGHAHVQVHTTRDGD